MESNYRYGLNFADLFQLTGQTRLGLTYRFEIDLDLEGNAIFLNASPLFISPLVNLFTPTQARSKLTLPATASLGITHDFNEKWSIAADLQWTELSSIKEVRIRFDNPSQPDSVETLN